jgi:hypothetical protein
VTGAGEDVEAGEVVWVLGVAGVEGTEGAEETGDAEVLVRAVEEVETIGALGTGEAITVGDAVEAGDIGRAGKVVRGGVAGARKSNIVKVSAVTILATIQPVSLPYSSGLRPSSEIACLQSHLGSTHSNISVLSYSTIMLRLVTTLLM